jgi:hypothetical protein
MIIRRMIRELSYRNHTPLYQLRGEGILKKQKGYEVDIEIGARCAFLAKNKTAAQARIRRHMRRFLGKRPVYAYRIRIKKVTETTLRK